MRYVYLITNGYDMVLVFRDGICYYATADASFPAHDPDSVKDFLRGVHQYADFSEWETVSSEEAEEWISDPQSSVFAEYGEEDLLLTAEMIWNSVQSSEDRDDFFWKDGTLCHYLDRMPFDKFEDGRGFIHALGYEVWSEEYQRWRTVYAD